MKEEYGSVLSVATLNVGAAFVAAASIGATTIFLDDVSMFDDLGGQVLIANDPFVYTAVNQDLNTMTLFTGLTVAAAIDDRVEIWPPAPVRSAMVQFGIEGGEAVQVTIPHFFSGLPDGARDTDEREVALVEERRPGELFLKDVMSKGMTVLGPGCNLDEYTAQGVFIQLKNANVSLALNYPTLYAGVLEVFSTQPGQIMTQRYTAYRNATVLPYPSVWTRVFYFLSGWSPWQAILDDTGDISTIGSIAVAQTDWTITTAHLRMRNNKEVWINLFFTYGGAGITLPGSGSGDIANEDICQMVAAYRPGNGYSQGGLSTINSGRMAAFCITTDGMIQMTAVGGTNNIVATNVFSCGGSYLLD